ncbi:uncharacterized protein V6R79_006108 [Siganus canaliculatus]
MAVIRAVVGTEAPHWPTSPRSGPVDLIGPRIDRPPAERRPIEDRSGRPNDRFHRCDRIDGWSGAKDQSQEESKCQSGGEGMATPCY